MQSTNDSQFGHFRLSSGTFYGHKEKDKGLCRNHEKLKLNVKPFLAAQPLNVDVAHPEHLLHPFTAGETKAHVGSGIIFCFLLSLLAQDHPSLYALWRPVDLALQRKRENTTYFIFTFRRKKSK